MTDLADDDEAAYLIPTPQEVLNWGEHYLYTVSWANESANFFTILTFLFDDIGVKFFETKSNFGQKRMNKYVPVFCRIIMCK